MPLQPGVDFAPYCLRLKRSTRPRAPPDNPITTSVSVEPHLQVAVAREDAHFELGGDDSEGLGVSSRPSSPIIGIEPEGLADPPAQPHLSSGMQPSAKKRRNSGAKKCRTRKRVKLASSGHQPLAYAANPSTVLHHAEEVEPLRVSADAKVFPKSESGSWVGQRKNRAKKEPWTVAELVENNFRFIEWDGCKTQLILDKDERIIAVLAGQPDDPLWKDTVNTAAEVMQHVEQQGTSVELFTEESLHHRRGEFLAIPTGVSFGGGQTAPGNLVHTAAMRQLIRLLLQSHSIKRIAGFQSSALAAYAPKLYRYLAQTLGQLFEKYPHLSHIFSNSIFPAASFNCGPRTVSFEHTDFNNLSHGLCALTALGDYDHKVGGHLILFGLKLAIQFPVGSTVLIPSGCMSHGNTPIGDGETRLSIAQYAAGGLFRWVAYGFRSAKSLIKTAAGKKLKKKFDKGTGERWREGLAMFSTLGGLQADAEAAFNIVG